MPRKETIVRTLYQFDELSDDAKENARDWYRSCMDSSDYDYDEFVASMKAFAAHYGFKVTHWEIGYRANGFTFESRNDGAINELSGARLFRYLMNQCGGQETYKASGGMVGSTDNPPVFKKRTIDGQDFIRHGKDGGCPFTGYYTDCPPFDVFAEFMAKPDSRALADLMDEAGEAMRIAYDRNCEDVQSDEHIDETIRINGYEFLADGSRA